MRRWSESSPAQTRVVWLTNFAAPYRLPVWREVAKHVDLQVLLVEKEGSRESAARPSSWLFPDPVVGYSISRLHRESTTNVASLPRLPLILAGADAIILGGWENPTYLLALMLARVIRRPVVGFYESTLDTQRHRSGLIALVRSQFFKHVRAVVVPGEGARQAMLAMGVENDKIYRGFNAVDVQDIHAAVTRLRQELPSDVSDSHRFVSIGQLIDRKNVEGTIHAFESIFEAGDRLDIYGKGPLEKVLKERAARTAVGEAIRFHGQIAYDGLPDVLASSNTLVLASTEEVWGLVVNEALAAGLHVVVTDVAGVVESVRTMAGVFVATPGAAGLADAMSRSRALWAGPIAEPAILQHTPEAFAGTFLSAIDAPIKVDRSPIKRSLHVVVVQPYVPRYRTAFFAQVSELLNAEGIRLTVAAPAHSPDTKSRADATDPQPWHTVTRALSLSLGRRSPRFNYLGSLRQIWRADAIILPAAATTLDVYAALLIRVIKRTPVGLWGHVGNYVTPANRLDRWIERILFRTVNHMFAYTASGTATATSYGIPNTGVTTMNNTIDVEELRTAFAELSPGDMENFAAEHDLNGHKIFGVLGGLDESKRIDFLAAVLDSLHAIAAPIKFVIGGRGTHGHLLDEAERRGQVIRLGYAGPHEKATMAYFCEALVNPGRIGLLAVDAMTLRLPIITSADFTFHAPEAEYLTQGITRFDVDGGPKDFAAYLLRFSNPGGHEIPPALAQMAQAFTRGTLQMLVNPL